MITSSNVYDIIYSTYYPDITNADIDENEVTRFVERYNKIEASGEFVLDLEASVKKYFRLEKDEK